MNDIPDKTTSPLTGRRNMARYCAVQALYQWRLTGRDLNGIIENELPFDSNLNKADVDYLRSLINYIASHRADLDKQLVALLDRPMERLDPVEVGILYVGLCELNDRPDTPVAVIIDEAVNLAHVFGCRDSSRYVNAVLHQAAAVRRASDAERKLAPRQVTRDRHAHASPVMDKEMDIIQRFLSHGPAVSGLLRGIGDDAALLQIADGDALAVSTDVLVAGRHFPKRCDPSAIGHKALAVNLSDLAATGAEPKWAFLCLTLPEADEEWLRSFSRGFFALAERYRVSLAGGDTTEGPLTVSVTICGTVPPALALSRAAASPGEDIWISGELGAAALAFRLLSGEAPPSAESWRDQVMPCLLTPEPRVREGLALRGIAGGCTDLSDGLARNLALMLEASGCGADIQLADLPLAPALRECVAPPDAWHMAIGFGDDYELCFTANSARRDEIAAAVSATRVGRVGPDPGIRWLTPGGESITIQPMQHHFSNP